MATVTVLVLTVVAMVLVDTVLSEKPDMEAIVKICVNKHQLTENDLKQLNNLPAWEKASVHLRRFIMCMNKEAKMIDDNGKWNTDQMYKEETEENKKLLDQCLPPSEAITNVEQKSYNLTSCMLHGHNDMD